MNSAILGNFDCSLMSVSEYRRLAESCTVLNPNPFLPYPGGGWHERALPQVVSGVVALLDRFDSGKVDEQQLLRGKDNDKRPGPDGWPRCYDTLSYWLYFQHHPGHELWKLLGQRYWSVAAYSSWCANYERSEAGLQADPKVGRYPLKTFPKRGPGGLVSEHVVPKKKMKELLSYERNPQRIRALLQLNLCCVLTKVEDALLETASHPNPMEPWLRYRGNNITLLHNPGWTDMEIQALLRNGLLSFRSIAPFQR